MDDLFSRKQINADGSHSNEFLINEEFVAMLDYYVVVSLSAKASEAERFRPYYRQRVDIYKMFDGKALAQNRPAWRPQLLALLKAWQETFPAVARKKKNRTSSAPDDAATGRLAITEDDL